MGSAIGAIIGLFVSFASAMLKASFDEQAKDDELYAQEKALQETNDFNQKQYEDWKNYNSLDERLKRAEKAGVSKWAALGLNDTLQQSFSVENATLPQNSPNRSLSDLVGSLKGLYGQAQNDYLSRKEKEFDHNLREEALKLQWEQLRALQQWRKENMAQQKWMFGEKLGWAKDSFMQGLQFKKDYYLNPAFSGYWNTQLAKQNFNFYQSANPVKLGLLRNELAMKQTEKNYLEDYLRSRNLSAKEGAIISGFNRYFWQRTIHNKVKAANILYNATITDPKNYMPMQYFDWSMDEFSKILGAISGIRRAVK